MAEPCENFTLKDVKDVENSLSDILFVSKNEFVVLLSDTKVHIFLCLELRNCFQNCEDPTSANGMGNNVEQSVRIEGE